MIPIDLYTDNDPKVCSWTEELVKAGIIPPGDVICEDIAKVRGEDVRGYRRVHWFAGIAGWAYALEIAGWSDEQVWTGSCPCQPFSVAGKGLGEKDARHLWPEFARLISECRPSVCFGEQVTSKAGREWLSRVRTDLEALGYAVGAADMCAASVGAPHIRQRLYWVADTTGREVLTAEPRGLHAESGGGGVRLADAERRNAQEAAQWWSGSEFIECADGKQRRVEPSIRLLADGVPSRLAKLRGLGNSIVPQVAAEFIKAYLEAREHSPF